MKLLILGFGYSAAATARALRAFNSDARVSGTVRTPERMADLTNQAVVPLLWDGGGAGRELVAEVAGTTHLLVSVAPGADGDPALRHLEVAIEAAEHLQWIGYFSTVGVYGDFGGAWIDEDAACRPVNPRSQVRLAVEEQWRRLAADKSVPLLILRLAGIYGPGRSPLDKLRDGSARRIVKQGQVFNRIHVDDIGSVTALAALRRLAGTFNLSDSEPAPPQEVVAHAAALLGMAPPPEVAFETAAMTPMARSFYSDNKRVTSTAVLSVLGTELRYPTYREGLAAILAAERSD